MKRISPCTAYVRRIYLFITLALLVAATVFPGRPLAQSGGNLLVITSVDADLPTIHMLGVQMLISGDQNQNAKVTVRYRAVGSTEWRVGLPLSRVIPRPTWWQTVEPQFAGTIFDLTPNTEYDIELTASDTTDGSVVQPVRTVRERTRPIPRQDPADTTKPRVTVHTATEFQNALNAAVDGTIITLANGTYTGQFAMYGSHNGTLADPIVIRGQSATGAILDGGGCDPCNVLEVWGSYIHVENLTIRNADRALRFQGNGTQNNVARRLRIDTVTHGIAPGTNQSDFYIADNIIAGRLKWPDLLDEGDHWDYRGVAVNGDGHVVYHNKISGFGDPMINLKPLARSLDFYGNDILNCFDGNELDLGGGNVRSIHNRFTNVAAGVSLQPVYGGPAYVLRNVMLNVTQDQIKLKPFDPDHDGPLPYDEPSGALIYHNTFVSPLHALNLQTEYTAHNFEFKNNLFVGPQAPTGRTVEWQGGIDGGKFDFNGYFPEGGFRLGAGTSYTNFAHLQASSPFEDGGRILTLRIFAAGSSPSGLVGPTGDGSTPQTPVNFNLFSTSNAIDHGTSLLGINRKFSGAAPDLGALETGCQTPTYGPRSVANENVVALVDCSAAPQSSLPSPWVNGDIGSVGLAGSASYSNGTFTVNGSGADIWDVADQFHFVYQALNGDGQIIARVASVENTDQFAKAGVMIRDTLTAGSRHVILDLKPDGGLEFMNRTTTGGSTSVVNGGTTVAIPHWLKLVRSGNTFTASRSSNGTSWTVVGTTTVTMAANVYIGLAVTSHNNTVLNTSTFNNVSVTQSSGDDFWTNLVLVTVNSTNGLTKNLDAPLGWNAGAYSNQVLTGDGYVEFTTAEKNTGKVLGLTTDVAGQNFTTIDYAISLGGGNQARIYERGEQKGLFTVDYQPGQKYRVSIEGNVVRYYKDGVAHPHVGSISPTHSLRIDTSLQHPGATITNVVIYSKLVWENPTLVTVNSTNGLTKNLDAPLGWNAGAYSNQVLTGDGYVEFSTDERFTGKMCGLTTDFAGQNYTGIDYTISLGGANLARIYENGDPKAIFDGEYQPGDKYRVSIEGNVVRYYKNGVAHSYTSSISPTHSLRVDTSLQHPGATITDVVFFGAWSN